MSMWRVTYTPETGPMFVALVKADRMDQALEKAAAEAEAVGIDEGRRQGTMTVRNEGAWPTVIIP